jgi:hypothetical protein
LCVCVWGWKVLKRLLLITHFVGPWTGSRHRLSVATPIPMLLHNQRFISEWFCPRHCCCCCCTAAVLFIWGLLECSFESLKKCNAAVLIYIYIYYIPFTNQDFILKNITVFFSQYKKKCNLVRCKHFKIQNVQVFGKRTLRNKFNCKRD